MPYGVIVRSVEQQLPDSVRTRGSGSGFYRVVRRMNAQSYRQRAESDVRSSLLLPLPFSRTVLVSSLEEV